jgi:glycosyltransferase involved in cell wall biosynthesis
MKKIPKISIITVVYNAEKLLERTIRSVAAQTYPHIEYIIVDGKSQDGTLDVIRTHEPTISRWISEEDTGLYDAMNKGMKLATGDYLWFMNAGDEIFDPQTLEKVFSKKIHADVFYGEAAFVDDKGGYLGTRSNLSTHKLPARLHWKSMQWGMAVSHQSFIVKSTIAPAFDLKYKLASDIDWVIHCLKAASLICDTGLILSRFMSNPVMKKFYAGGMSKKYLFQGLKERFCVYRYHYGLFKTLLNHILIAYKAFLYFVRPLKTP